MNKHLFRGEIKHAEAHPYVQAALNGDPKGAKIETPMLNNKCVTPNDKFNAVTAAMQLIRFKPDRELIKKPIVEDYEPGSLEQILVNLLNDTIQRQPSDKFVHTTEEPRPLYNDEVRQYCHEAEIGFIESALNQNGSRNKIYADQSGEPVFFKKFYPRGVATALAMQPVSFNGIELPPGTIVDLKEKQSTRRLPNSGVMVIKDIDDRNLTAAYPLRLSSFSLTDKDRYETFGTHNQRGMRLSDFERQANIEDIKNHLPEPAAILGCMAMRQEVSDIKYAA